MTRTSSLEDHREYRLWPIPPVSKQTTFKKRRLRSRDAKLPKNLPKKIETRRRPGRGFLRKASDNSKSLNSSSNQHQKFQTNRLVPRGDKLVLCLENWNRWDKMKRTSRERASLLFLPTSLTAKLQRNRICLKSKLINNQKKITIISLKPHKA